MGQRFKIKFSLFITIILQGGLVLAASVLTPNSVLKSPIKSPIIFKENKGQVYDQNFKSRLDVLFSGTDGNLVYHLKNKGISYQINKVEEWKEME